MPKATPEQESRSAAVPGSFVDYRTRRRKALIGMVICALAVNLTERFYIDRHPVLSDTTRVVMLMMILAGFVLIGFYIAACIAYARMRGLSRWLGVGGAMVGLATWLGITLWLQWPTISALINESPTPDWDTHPSVALWAGLAAGGLLLKAIPVRNGGESSPSREATLATPTTAPTTRQKKA